MSDSDQDQEAVADARPGPPAPPVEELEVDVIRSRGWRDLIDGGDPAYRVLLASVRSRGVLIPLVVRTHSDGSYQLVSGARRLQAAREAGRTTVPVMVRSLGDVEALVGGAWAALTRTGVSEPEVERLRAQLIDSGVTEADAELLAGSLPRAGEEAHLTGSVSVEPETPAPAWAWGAAIHGSDGLRRGRLRWRRRG
jgi:hypothetical protein